MKVFNKVAIIGVGLIGGSIALAIKRKHLAKQIVGVSFHQSSVTTAKKLNIIDAGSTNLNIIRGADLVIFATPVNTIIEDAFKVSKLVKENCLITDVGSTKSVIVRKLDKLFPRFIGGHPLAGSEKRGIKNATYKLFDKTTCILTPTKNTEKQALFEISAFWKALGCNVVIMPCFLHDKILSFVSHLPHIVSYSLIESIPKDYFKFASTGLKSTTRIAASDAKLWTEIFLSNKDNICSSIEQLEKNILKVKQLVKKNNYAGLKSFLQRAKIKREQLNDNSN